MTRLWFLLVGMGTLASACKGIGDRREGHPAPPPATVATDNRAGSLAFPHCPAGWQHVAPVERQGRGKSVSAGRRLRHAGVSYIDGDGKLVKVATVDDVPVVFRGAMVGERGTLGKPGSYSVVHLAKLPPPAVAKAAVKPSAAVGDKVAAVVGQPRVDVFGTAWCPACRAAKEHLSRAGVLYRTRDIEDDPVALAEYTSYGGNKVPLVVIGETAISGFDPSAIDRALGR